MIACFDAKWWNSEGWRMPTASAIWRVDVPS